MTAVDEAPLRSAGCCRPGTLRGTEGFFRAGQDAAGFWWLVDPAGDCFFARGVHGVCPISSAPGHAGSIAPSALLRRLGFNAVGLADDGGPQDDGFPHLRNANFCGAGAVVAGPGVRLPDVFAPDWPQVATAHALSVCRPHASSRDLLGWVTDDAPGWGQPTKTGRPSLLQICLGLEPGLATYHAAWEFVLALHRGDLASVGRSWGVELRNREIVRELVRMDVGLATRGYLRDEARWTREFARRYFATASAAVRAADPHHLVFGCRFDGPAGPHVLAESVYPAVDVAMPDAAELPPPGPAGAPVLAANLHWPEESAGPATGNGSRPRLTAFERMLRRGRLVLDRLGRHPSVVGYAWSQWRDRPDEQPPFARGLVHANGAEAREHTELLAAFNARVESRRRAAAASTSS